MYCTKHNPFNKNKSTQEISCQRKAYKQGIPQRKQKERQKRKGWRGKANLQEEGQAEQQEKMYV